MKYTFTLEKTEKNTILLFAPNGGVLYSFNKKYFYEIQTIRGAAIEMVKEHTKLNLKPYVGEEVVLIDKTNIVHEVCSECGSIDVDIKAWVSEKDGYISKPEEVEKDDCWCNKCEQHIEPEQKGGDYTLYNSTQNIKGDISEELPLGAECSSDWLRKIKDENGFVTLNLDFDLNEFIENNIEWLNDESSQRITGSEAGLTDISYKTISVLDNGRILIAVTGNVNDFLDELDEEA